MDAHLQQRLSFEGCTKHGAVRCVGSTFGLNQLEGKDLGRAKVYEDV